MQGSKTGTKKKRKRKRVDSIAWLIKTQWVDRERRKKKGVVRIY